MIYYLIGLILIILGCFHKIDLVARTEPNISQFFQEKFKQNPFLVFFKDIWIFGRTTFSLIMLFLLTIYEWKAGLVAVGAFIVIIGIEYAIKSLYFRNRPFNSQHGISMLQPFEPLDSSFPSGDSLRVWYMALTISAALGGGSYFLIAVILLAILVTFGRLVMGVHYLTDTLTGAGLGIIGAGTTILLWNLLNI